MVACAGKVGPEENITIVEPNHVTLDLSLTKKEEDQKQKDPLDAIADGKSMFVCKYCGEKVRLPCALLVQQCAWRSAVVCADVRSGRR